MLAMIHILCELAWQNPHERLHLVPHLFYTTTLSSNNWMLI
jgi:AP-3 complex subunit delta-1